MNQTPPAAPAVSVNTILSAYFPFLLTSHDAAKSGAGDAAKRPSVDTLPSRDDRHADRAGLRMAH